MRYATFLLCLPAAASALLLAGCSVIISGQTEADCADVSSCGAYVCAPDGVACLDMCLSDSDCSAGNLCDFGTGMCQSTGCTPVSGVVEYPDLTGQWTEMAAAYSPVVGQTIVTLGGPIGLGFRRLVGPGGELLSDGLTNPGEVLAIEGPAPSRGAFRPVVEHFAAGESTSEEDRFVILWRFPGTSQEFIRSRTLLLDGDPVVGEPQRIFEPRRTEEVADINLLPYATDSTDNPEGFMAFWTIRSGDSREVHGVLTDAGGLGLDGEAQVDADGDNTVFANAPGSSFTSAFTAGTDSYVAFRTTGGGFNVLVQPITPNAEGRFDFEPLDRVSVSGPVDVDIQNVRTASAGETGGVVWAEERGASYGILHAHVGANGPGAGSGRLIDDEFTHSDSLRTSVLGMAGRDGEYVVAFTGIRAGSEDIWLMRFDAAGNRVAMPHPLTAGGAPDVTSLEVFETEDGYAVMWLSQNEDAQTEVSYRRLRCE